MANRERTDKFNKVASVNDVRETSFSTKHFYNTHHVNISDSNTTKNNFYVNSGKKVVQNRNETQKQFEEPRNAERTSKESSKGMTSDRASDSNGWQQVRGRKKSEKERYIKPCENKIFAQHMNRDGFKSSERHTVQNISQQRDFNKNRKSAFRVQSKCINSNRCENKMDSAYKNSISHSSVSENVHSKHKENSKNTEKEKIDASTSKLNSRGSREKQSEDLVSSNKGPTNYSLDETNCLLKNTGAITKTTQTFKQTHGKNSTFVTDVKTPSMPKTKTSQLNKQKNEVSQSNLLHSKEIASDKTCKISKDENISQTQENDTNRCDDKIEETVGYLKEQISEEAKANLTNEEEDDKMADYAEHQHAPGSLLLKDEGVENHLEYELQYCRHNNGYLLCRPRTVYPTHQYIPNSTFGQHFINCSDSGTPCQQLVNEKINENPHTESLNTTNYYQEQYSKVIIGNKVSETARNDCSYSNVYMHDSENLNYAYCTPLVMSWHENGAVYYQYYPVSSPVQYACFAPSVSNEAH